MSQVGIIYNGFIFMNIFARSLQQPVKVNKTIILAKHIIDLNLSVKHLKDTI